NLEEKLPLGHPDVVNPLLSIKAFFSEVIITNHISCRYHGQCTVTFLDSNVSPWATWDWIERIVFSIWLRRLQAVLGDNGKLYVAAD
ncbi:2712_t:CDS:1, partial [Acaulospora colombiana]